MPSRSKRKKKPTTTGPVGPSIRTVADNRRARFDYEILERFEAGVSLSGTEIKSVRAGQTSIREAYAQVRAGEVWLQQMHIAPWASGGPWNHEPVRPRRLLLHRGQIFRLGRMVNQKGLTIVPLRVYIKGHYAKVEVALARGRRQYDKRQAIMRRETDREISRSLRQG